MKIIKQISIVVVLIICFSCKNNSSNPDDNQGGNPKYGGSPSNHQDTNSFPDPDESGPEYGDKVVEWPDGNTYTYDYTEQIEWKDSTGTRDVTVYMRNKPTNVQCNIANCEWCGEEMSSQGYTIDEFPNLDVYRGKGNMMNAINSILQVAINGLRHKSYFDLDNNRIRTEWTVNCDYGGPDGFCSMKCQSEYNNR